MSMMSASASSALLDVSRAAQPVDLLAALNGLRAVTGLGLSQLVREYFQAAIGPGKLTFEEFVTYRRLIPASSDVCLTSFAGHAVSPQLWDEANFRIDAWGLVSNKIACNALLSANGFPVIPIRALFTAAAGPASGHVLRDGQALAAFLRDPSHYPLFAKPLAGLQSLGALSLARYDGVVDGVIDWQGTCHNLPQLVEEILSHYGSGYLFQPLQLPHPQNRALCGSRLSTVRVLTIRDGDGARVFRVCEKLPAGANAADNFWRPGNLLVPVDIETGRRGTALSGTGIGLSEHSHHPDSGLAITGSFVPEWQAVKTLAVSASSVFPQLGLLGWDIAPVEGGAVIVEANETPDLALPQIASRRGILDEEFRRFLASQRGARAARKAEARRGRRGNAVSALRFKAP